MVQLEVCIVKVLGTIGRLNVEQKPRDKVGQLFRKVELEWKLVSQECPLRNTGIEETK
ncbi:hypothetical protein HAX54_004568, partial [Datura stramonium]|nr:hypothetical protein [Datura stramonium]